MNAFADQFKKLGIVEAANTADSSATTWDFEIAATPLQTLKNKTVELDPQIRRRLRNNSRRLKEQENQTRKDVLQAAVDADKKADDLYKALCDRNQLLADEIVTANFPWRLRVCGFRGFQELLLPALHPIYGIPYIPASSLKGLVKTWVQNTLSKDEYPEAKRLLGYLDLNKEESALAAVQILDAFPEGHCLSLDIANAQWHWDNRSNKVEYGPEPHIMLSLLNPTIKIALKQTCIGKPGDVKIVRDWLEQAIRAEGVGGRTSAGYGRASIQKPIQRSVCRRYHRSEHPFELWSEGIHGIDSNRDEMRPVALRGILRYWFRAIALGLYIPETARQLENDFFGTIDGDSPTEGYIRLELHHSSDEQTQNSQAPSYTRGSIFLESKPPESSAADLSAEALEIAQQLLQLGTHIGSVGRGSRRPLHWNKPRFRGGYLQLLNKSDSLECNAEEWKALFDNLKKNLAKFRDRQVSSRPFSLGEPGRRRQDIINQDTAIYLIPHKKLLHPNKVKRWNTEGERVNVRGIALDFFYKSGYKGGNNSQGTNAQVGGNLGTPSFVWITSNYLHEPEKAYQAVTILGTDNRERENFSTALAREFRNKGLITVNFT